MANEVSDLPPELMDDIASNAAEAVAWLMLDADATPLSVVEAIADYVRKLREDDCRLEEDDTVRLGALLGEQYVKQFGWRWVQLSWNDAAASRQICVLNPQQSVFIAPLWWVNAVLTAGRPNNFLLNFNMVAAGNLPKAPKAPKASLSALLGFH